MDYLENNGAKKCPPKANPAEYMLEANGAGNPDYSGQDWGDVWERSPENDRLKKEIQEIVSNRRNASKNSNSIFCRVAGFCGPSFAAVSMTTRRLKDFVERMNCRVR